MFITYNTDKLSFLDDKLATKCIFRPFPDLYALYLQTLQEAPVSGDMLHFILMKPVTMRHEYIIRR